MTIKEIIHELEIEIQHDANDLKLLTDPKSLALIEGRKIVAESILEMLLEVK